MKEYPGKLISFLYRKSQIFWSQILKEHNITSAEYPVIIVLNKKDGITQEEISSELGLDKSAITRVVKSLLEKGFIERQKNQEDLRCNKIYLTEKGHSCWKYIKEGMEKWNSIMSKDIETKEVEEVVSEIEKTEDYIVD